MAEAVLDVDDKRSNAVTSEKCAATQMRSKKFPNEKCLFFPFLRSVCTVCERAVLCTEFLCISFLMRLHARLGSAHTISILFETNERRRDVFTLIRTIWVLQRSDFVWIMQLPFDVSVVSLPNLAQYRKLKVSFFYPLCVCVCRSNSSSIQFKAGERERESGKNCENLYLNLSRTEPEYGRRCEISLCW